MPSQDRADEILSRFPGPMMLYPSRRKWLLILLTCVAFVAIGIWMSSETPKGWFVLAFFGACLVIAAVVLLPGAAALKLDREGFETTKLFCRYSVRWQDATGFEAARIAGNDMVVYDDRNATGRAIASLNVALVGRNAGLPDTYALPAEVLASLMARWRERAVSPR
jgi:hypothetical protein